MGYQQATIPVVDTQAFTALRGMIEAALGEHAEKYLGSMAHFGLNIREFEKAIEKGIIERAVGQSGSHTMYGKLPVTDQGQLREFYLTRVDEVDSDLKEKYKKLYRYA